MPTKIVKTSKPVYTMFFLLFVLFVFTACNAQTIKNNNSINKTSSAQKQQNTNYNEGSDYLIFQRVRLMDNVGFAKPEEAYSILLPKGWQHQDEIIWNTPGTTCEGTFRRMHANAADGKYNLEILPDIIFIWNTDPQLMQFYMNNPMNSPYCKLSEPMDAETYLRNVFAPQELGNPSITQVESNPFVVQQMKQANEKNMRELLQYGAGQMQFYQTAVNAAVSWANGKEGLVTLGVTILETIVPNAYNGTYSKIYTTQVTQRTVFTYPKEKSEEAKNEFSVIMASFRTNPAWQNAVNGFWKDVRQKKQVAHIGRIQAMDAQTHAMGEAAINKGQQRLNTMDNDMRNWEASQATDDKIHTNFVKTIREVENYKDASGTYELSSSYDHAWSRSDGTSFVMSNSPNFDPQFVFNDQQWQEMKKVE